MLSEIGGGIGGLCIAADIAAGSPPDCCADGAVIAEKCLSLLPSLHWSPVVQSLQRQWCFDALIRTRDALLCSVSNGRGAASPQQPAAGGVPRCAG